MDFEERRNISVGVRLLDSGFITAYFKQGMREAEVLINPQTDDIIWSIQGVKESEYDSGLFRNGIQSGVDSIIQILGKNISNITFSIESMSEKRATDINSALEQVDFYGITYCLQEDEESFYDFVIFQNNNLWVNEVVYFIEKDKKLYAKSLVQAPYPHEKALTVRVDEFENFDFGAEDDETDKNFCSLAEKFFDRRLITSVFLEGDVFSKNWMHRTLKFLCKNRRVFGVSDLIVKGACYRPLRKSPSEMKSKYYMGTHQLPFNVSMLVTDNDKDELCRVVHAGRNWYDSDFKWFFMINDVDELHFRIDPASAESQRYIDVDISWIPERPRLATKIEVIIHFAGKNKWYIKVTDLGLGELYPSEHKDTTVYLGEW